MVKTEKRVKPNYQAIYDDATKCKEEIHAKIEAQFADDLLALDEIISHCMEDVEVEVPDEEPAPEAEPLDNEPVDPLEPIME